MSSARVDHCRSPTRLMLSRGAKKNAYTHITARRMTTIRRPTRLKIVSAGTVESYNSKVKSVSSQASESRLVAAIDLLRTLLQFHRKTFFVAVGGAAVFALCTVASSFAISRMIDRVIEPYFRNGGPILGLFVGASLVIAAVGIVRAIAVVVRRSFAGVTQWRTSATLAEQVIRTLLHKPYSWHMRHQPGDLVARVGVDADSAVVILGPLPYATSVVILLAVSGFSLVRVDPFLGSLALVVLPLMLLVNVVYQRRVDRHFEAAQHALGAFSEAAYESLEGYSVVKAFGAEGRETQRMARISRRLRDARIRAIKGRATFDGLMDAVPALINVGLIVVGAHRVAGGVLTVGELSGFVYLFTLLVFPLRIVGYVFSELPKSRSGMDRVKEMLEEPIDEDPIFGEIANPSHSVELRSVRLEIDGVHILDDVDLSIQRGVSVAIVGPTGAGKTSLLHVIAGLVRPTSGTVATSGSRTSIVLQEPFLFDGSVRENVLLGDGDESMLDNALRWSRADEFVGELPDGVSTQVGERGVGLSGGQRQRLCLARALCRENDLLLLDDTTSALDTRNEVEVLFHLRNLTPRTTLIMATSRPSVIRHADVVVFMRGGRVEHVGTNDEIQRMSDEYRRLIEAYESGHVDD